MPMSMSGGGGGSTDPVALRGDVYRSLRDMITATGSLSNVTHASNANLEPFTVAQTLTINSGVSVRVNSEEPHVILCDSLVLNGTINATGDAGASGVENTEGGDGGRTVFVLARVISGSGTINAYGGAGQNGVAPPGSSEGVYMGNDGQFFYANINNTQGYLMPSKGGQGKYSTSAAVSGGSKADDYLWKRFRALPYDLLTWVFPTLYLTRVYNGSINLPAITSYSTLNRLVAAGGGGGGMTTSSSSYATGGGGGGSFVGAGGAGGTSAGGVANVNGGGGGGGGGIAVVFSLEAIPGINLNAYGANGGSGYGAAGGGGGAGAGGIVHQYAPSSTATVNVAAGTGGAAGGASSGAGGNGEAGISYVFDL